MSAQATTDILVTHKPLTVFSQQEAEALILALSRGQSRFTEAEAVLVLEWASRIRADLTLLNLVLTGQVALCFYEGVVHIVANDPVDNDNE